MRSIMYLFSKQKHDKNKTSLVKESPGPSLVKESPGPGPGPWPWAPSPGPWRLALGPGPWPWALGPEPWALGPGSGPEPGPSKSKIDLRLKKKCSGRPVCADRSVSARRYERTDFRLTQKIETKIEKHIYVEKTLKIRENPILPNLDPYYPMGWPYFSTWPYFSKWVLSGSWPIFYHLV